MEEKCIYCGIDISKRKSGSLCSDCYAKRKLVRKILRLARQLIGKEDKK